MLNIYLAVFIIFMLILWRETPKEKEMATIEILTALVRGGMSPVGACAMGGNMMAESGMKSNIAQRGMTKLSDEEYTRSVDNGTYRFAQDGVGYGLCQWTYHTRKADLLDFAKSIGKSVGDEGMQVKFCLHELQSEYADLWKYLQTTKDLHEATELICEKYERPAVNNVHARYKYARQLYNDYGETIAAGASPRPTEGNADREPESYIMGTVKPGEHTPEACFLMAQLKRVGYDVLWLGLDACLRDFQQKRGLEVDGVCGEKTWREILQ